MKGPKAQKLYDMLKFSQLRLMHEQILHSHLICHACYIIIPTIYLFLMFFFPYKYPYFLYLDYIYFLAVLSAAPSGYIFFVFYIRKRSYAAMFVCKS